MVELKEETFESILEKTIQHLHSSESKLVSYTKKIHDINPLHFFEAGKLLHMDRTYWMSTLDKFTMAGVGTAYTIQEEDTNISQIDDAWTSVLSEAVNNNPYTIPGTGIAAVGGMAFDPLKAQTELWNGFGENELRIPKFHLVVYQGEAYLTTTVKVNAKDNSNELLNQLEQEEHVLLSQSTISSNGAMIRQQQEVAPQEWKELVQRTTEYIASGQAEKIVLARELQLELTEEVNIADVLRKLIDTQPTSYIFAYEKNNTCFIGATPERLVKVENNTLLSTCLAGTAPRGKTETEDEELGHQLLHDKKNLEEHDFVVQMIKNSIEEYCQELEIPDKPVLYKLRNLQHLYTPVQGKFKEGNTIFDVVEKLHPTPALGGEPREEALSYIREHELLDRGWYGAPFGWVDSSKNGEFAVAIRSGLIAGNKASLFAGCGVVEDSNPEAEFEETRIKFLPMLTVLGG